MALTEAQILSRMNVGQNAPQRNAIIADFLSEGLDEIRHMTEEDVREMCSSYAKRQDGPFPIRLTPIQKQRITSLVLWVQDQARIDQPMEFEDGTSAQELRQLLSEALERERRRKVQKKEGQSYLDSEFNTKLRTAAQWEKWNEELESTLCQVIGVRGVPLSYVIRTQDQPEYDEDLEYDEVVIGAMSLEGVEFRQDARTVHKIITKNIHEDSDAYTYIKTLTRQRDGRKDIKALRLRYDSKAMRQTSINKAKSDLETLRYKNERSFNFEKFSARLQKAYDDLKENGREVHNGDVVDALWKRIQTPELQPYIAALKVDYQQTSRDYKLILQDIAAEIGQQRTTSFAPGRNVSATYTRKGPCPTSGVHSADGSIFIGSYDRDKWQSAEVKKYHQEIFQARSQDEGGSSQGSQGTKRRASAIKRNKKKLKNLKAKISAAQAKLQEHESGTKEQEAVPSTPKNAGDAFGGKKAKVEGL